MNCYWPTEGSIKIGMWIIELLNENSYTEYVLREFKVTNSEVSSLLTLKYNSSKVCNAKGIHKV